MQHQVDAFLYIYRNTPHSLTKCTPAELFLGRKTRTHLSSLNPISTMKKDIMDYKKTIQERRGGRERTFQEGELIWAHILVRHKRLFCPGTKKIKQTSINSY
jgi:hypothetical protein